MSHFFVLDVPHATPGPHVPPLHVFEQHSLAPPHAEPSGLHGGGGLGTQISTASQRCEQHSFEDEHAEPLLAHGGGGGGGGGAAST